MSFLTLEDINGTIYDYGKQLQYYELDTSLIGTSDFTNVRYDFCTVTRETSGSNITYTIKVDNIYWYGGYYLLKSNRDLISTVPDYEDGTITYTTTEQSIILGLTLQDTMGLFEFHSVKNIILSDNIIPITLEEKGDSFTYEMYNLEHKQTHTGTLTLSSFGPKISNIIWFIVLRKTNLQYTLNPTLIIGKVNKVPLGTDNKYKPGGTLINNYTPTITVEYNEEILPVYWDSSLNDYCFDLDLTQKTTTGKIRLTVNIESNKAINQDKQEWSLDTNYQTITTFADLKNNCEEGGADIIRLGADITFTNNILVEHNIKIIGNNTNLDLNNHTIQILEGMTLKAEMINFHNGDPSIIQQKNTILELNGCLFQDCTSGTYNDLGSCIFCDIDINSLTVTDDFNTTLTGCTFINNTNCILHGGVLIVDNCRLHNTDITSINKNNVAFLYQVDGGASIRNSTFDIDYTSTTLCTNQESIGYAQALIMIGETATINGAKYAELGKDNTLPFFELPYNNQAHIFAEYYYPQISACVYTSPITNYEDKSCCHCLSGVDWIFKDNAKVTRASWDTQNETRKIIWED